MKRYEVGIDTTATFFVDVQAENEEEAREKAIEEARLQSSWARDYHYLVDDLQVVSIEEASA